MQGPAIVGDVSSEGLSQLRGRADSKADRQALTHETYDLANPLTYDERLELALCEQVFADRTRPFYEWGRALANIQRSKLFRASHRTFAEYCGKRWSVDRTYVHRLIRASEVVYYALLPMGNIPLPKHERQVRALTSLDRRLAAKIRMQSIKNGESNRLLLQEATRAPGDSRMPAHRGTPQMRQRKIDARCVGPSSLSERLEPPKFMRMGAKDSPPLTKRELEILQLFSTGKSGKEIADSLGVSINTVYNHKRNIHAKVGAHNSIEALRKIMADKGVLPEPIRDLRFLVPLTMVRSGYCTKPL